MSRVSDPMLLQLVFFFFSSRSRHTIFDCDWSSDVCSSDLEGAIVGLDALDQAIGGGRDRRESWGQARDSLMVHAVHRECLGLEQPGQPRARGDPHVMRALVAAAAADRAVVVLDRCRVLGTDVLVA